MKRFLTLMLTAAALSALLGVSASASSYDRVAQELSTIGMFRGTAAGFELDRAPTRSEAAIMLVRLYGAEDTAKAAYDAGEITHPFTDVSAFVSPYVAWLYSNDITKGTSASTFGSGNACTLQNYVVFLLRALGYKDSTDFTYDGSLAFAQTCGFYNEYLFGGDFLRDDLAALTYQALAVNVKGGETSLLESLVASGAIDAEAARPISEKIGSYRALLKAYDAMELLSSDMDLAMKLRFAAQADGESFDINADMSGNAKIILADSLQMAFSLKGGVSGLEGLGLGLESLGSTFAMDCWLRDNTVYYSVTAAGETEKWKVTGDTADLTDMTGLMDALKLDAGSNVSGLAAVKSVTAQTSGGETTYTIAIDTRPLLQLVLDVLGVEDEAALAALGVQLDMTDLVVRYVIAGETLKRCDMDFTASAQIAVPAVGDTPAQTGSVTVAFHAEVNVNATGSAVTITYPDFSEYQELGAL